MMPANAEPAQPRDAASLVIIDASSGEPKVLLGKRRMSQAFAPGKYVFPGGSLDAADSELACGGRLVEHHRGALAHGLRPGHPLPEAYARAAIRETFEETGLLLGAAGSAPEHLPEAWQPIYALGVGPNLPTLAFIARAITPPGRSRRFDARFFLADASAISHRTQNNDGEFEEIGWCGLVQAKAMDLHGMTLSVIEEAVRFLALTQADRRIAPVPFFFQDASGWQRSFINRSPTTRGT